MGTGSTVLRTIDGGLTWEKVNIDTEQKYMLADIFFIDDQQGWIVGGNGSNGGSSIILHTTDGGNYWQFQRAPTLNHLTSVFFKDEVHGWITGAHGTLLSTENGGVDWHLAVKATSNALIAVSFVDKEHGWAIGTSTLIHTKDGGTTWVSCDTLEGNDIVFVDRHKGWFVHAAKGIYHTEDGGNTWQLQYGIKGFYRISFADSLHGWAISSDSAGADILHTQDGGKSWLHQFRLPSPSMQSIFFANSLMGWAVGDSGVIYHTDDGGKSWKFQHEGIKGEYILNDVFFVNDSTGWVVGGTGIWHTTNGGKLWQRQLCPLNWEESLQAVHFTDENHGWAGSLGVMLYTEDGGKHWHRYYSQDFDFWRNDIYFIDRDHGWAVGSYGAVYKWSGNALAIADTKQEELPKHFELQQNYPNPFSPQLSLSGTKINYSLPTSAPVSIKIFNLLGQIVYIFDEREQPPGNHSITWNGQDNFGNILPNGIYFYQVQAGKEIRVGKMTLLR
ncbi:MAG: YCF48-related protein [candidate division KSB1 bacterium]|nr:YCF48-related protein [candidate division KSB1 bacterium]